MQFEGLMLEVMRERAKSCAKAGMALMLFLGLASMIGCTVQKEASTAANGSTPAPASVESVEDEPGDAGASVQAEPAPVDRDELNNLIDECGKLEADDYTKESFKEFKAALKEAKSVAKDESKTQNQVDSAVVNLQMKVESLVEVFNPDKYKSVKYEKIARNPDDYTGAQIKFSGIVLQVSEGEDQNMLRLGTKDEYDDVVIVGYDPTLKKERILEGDSVTVYGECVGLYSYEAVLGNTITLPALFAAEITIND